MTLCNEITAKSDAETRTNVNNVFAGPAAKPRPEGQSRQLVNAEAAADAHRTKAGKPIKGSKACLPAEAKAKRLKIADALRRRDRKRQKLQKRRTDGSRGRPTSSHAMKEELDPNIVNLVTVLNRFRGICTIGSCGGHANPGQCQWREGTFYVRFEVSWSREGQVSLEFLGWALDACTSNQESPAYLTFAEPRFINPHGPVCYCAIEGRGGVDPEKLAVDLDFMRRTYYENRDNKRLLAKMIARHQATLDLARHIHQDR
jgi:hypothetical protein